MCTTEVIFFVALYSKIWNFRESNSMALILIGKPEREHKLFKWNLEKKIIILSSFEISIEQHFYKVNTFLLKSKNVDSTISFYEPYGQN